MCNFEHSIDEIAAVLVDRGVASKRNLVGCLPSEIEAIENDVGLPLPDAYREFLARMGREMGDFYRGTDMTYRWLPGMTQAARELVQEDESDIELPADAIAFAMHQGYQFMFIRASEGGDPPVYYYMEMSGEFIRKADHLTEFLFRDAHDNW
ncbi:SMI1/KNR4 family protein [Bremerella cremea]|uniref:SMI1/KNR4 family protein n=1 Tax=Bremerella cremea TaxID=1031537 RepID=UPI0031E965E1